MLNANDDEEEPSLVIRRSVKESNIFWMLVEVQQKVQVLGNSLAQQTI